MGFLSFLLARDNLGHPVTLNYKGNDNHPSCCGAILTISIKIMVLFYCLQEASEMVSMGNPAVQSYERPLYEHEVEELGEMVFGDYHYNFGVYLYSFDMQR